MAVRKINIDDSEISVIFGLHDEDYICLTDMVKAGDNSDRTNIVIQNWMRRKDTISYLGVWENLHNPNFKSIEFDAIKNASGTNRFILTAKEADVLNVALFGMTAKEWRDAHPDDKGNIRDYATINQLICLSNMENLNAVFINEGLPQGERLQKLNQIAIQQMTVLENAGQRNVLKA